MNSDILALKRGSNLYNPGTPSYSTEKIYDISGVRGSKIWFYDAQLDVNDKSIADSEMNNVIKNLDYEFQDNDYIISQDGYVFVINSAENKNVKYITQLFKDVDNTDNFIQRTSEDVYGVLTKYESGDTTKDVNSFVISDEDVSSDTFNEIVKVIKSKLIIEKSSQTNKSFFTLKTVGEANAELNVDYNTATNTYEFKSNVPIVFNTDGLFKLSSQFTNDNLNSTTKHIDGYIPVYNDDSVTEYLNKLVKLGRIKVGVYDLEQFKQAFGLSGTDWLSGKVKLESNILNNERTCGVDGMLSYNNDSYSMPVFDNFANILNNMETAYTGARTYIYNRSATIEPDGENTSDLQTDFRRIYNFNYTGITDLDDESKDTSKISSTLEVQCACALPPKFMNTLVLVWVPILGKNIKTYKQFLDFWNALDLSGTNLILKFNKYGNIVVPFNLQNAQTNSSLDGAITKSEYIARDITPLLSNIMDMPSDYAKREDCFYKVNVNDVDYRVFAINLACNLSSVHGLDTKDYIVNKLIDWQELGIYDAGIIDELNTNIVNDLEEYSTKYAAKSAAEKVVIDNVNNVVAELGKIKTQTLNAETIYRKIKKEIDVRIASTSNEIMTDEISKIKKAIVNYINKGSQDTMMKSLGDSLFFKIIEYITMTNLALSDNDTCNWTGDITVSTINIDGRNYGMNYLSESSKFSVVKGLNKDNIFTLYGDVQNLITDEKISQSKGASMFKQKSKTSYKSDDIIIDLNNHKNITGCIFPFIITPDSKKGSQRFVWNIPIKTQSTLYTAWKGSDYEETKDTENVYKNDTSYESLIKWLGTNESITRDFINNKDNICIKNAGGDNVGDYLNIMMNVNDTQLQKNDKMIFLTIMMCYLYDSFKDNSSLKTNFWNNLTIILNGLKKYAENLDKIGTQIMTGSSYCIREYTNGEKVIKNTLMPFLNTTIGSNSETIKKRFDNLTSIKREDDSPQAIINLRDKYIAPACKGLTPLQVAKVYQYYLYSYYKIRPVATSDFKSALQSYVDSIVDYNIKSQASTWFRPIKSAQWDVDFHSSHIKIINQQNYQLGALYNTLNNILLSRKNALESKENNNNKTLNLYRNALVKVFKYYYGFPYTGFKGSNMTGYSNHIIDMTLNDKNTGKRPDWINQWTTYKKFDTGEIGEKDDLETSIIKFLADNNLGEFVQKSELVDVYGIEKQYPKQFVVRSSKNVNEEDVITVQDLINWESQPLTDKSMTLGKYQILQILTTDKNNNIIYNNIVGDVKDSDFDMTFTEWVHNVYPSFGMQESISGNNALPWSSTSSVPSIRSIMHSMYDYIMNNCNVIDEDLCIDYNGDGVDMTFDKGGDSDVNKVLSPLENTTKIKTSVLVNIYTNILMMFEDILTKYTNVMDMEQVLYELDMKKENELSKLDDIAQTLYSEINKFANSFYGASMIDKTEISLSTISITKDNIIPM